MTANLCLCLRGRRLPTATPRIVRLNSALGFEPFRRRVRDLGARTLPLPLTSTDVDAQHSASISKNDQPCRQTRNHAFSARFPFLPKVGRAWSRCHYAKRRLEGTLGNENARLRVFARRLGQSQSNQQSQPLLWCAESQFSRPSVLRMISTPCAPASSSIRDPVGSK